MIGPLISGWLRRRSGSDLDGAKDWVREGDAAFSLDDFAQAESHYRTAVAIAPKFAPAHLGLGAALQAQGRFYDAVSALKAAVGIDGKLVNAHELLGASYLALSDFAQAELHLRHAIALDGAAPLNYLHLGGLLVAQKRYQEALQSVSQGAQGNPDFADLQFFLGNVQFEMGQFAQAVASYRAALKLWPDHSQLSYNLGLALVKTNELESASDAFLRTTNLSPDWADVWNNLGYVYHRLGRLEAAGACFERALTLQPMLAMAHFNVGELALAQGDLGRAIQSFKEAIMIDADMAQSHLRLAMALIVAGQQEAAVSHLERCLEIVPSDTEPRMQLAKLYEVQEKHQLALGLYREIAAAEPERSEALIGIALALQRLAERDDTMNIPMLEEAAATCRAVISRAPDHLPARMCLGIVLGQGGKVDEADREFEDILKLDPGNAVARHNLGVSMEARARIAPASDKQALYEKALEHYTAAVAAEPHHIDALMGVASVHVEQLRSTDAAIAYERILQIDPEYAPARMSYAMLKLKVGDFESGWCDFESRWRMGDRWMRIRFKSDKPQWHRDIDLADRTIILYHEQGLGDSLQFIRYARLVADLGARVLVKPQPALKQLFASCPGVHGVFDGDEVPEHDYHFPLMSLPLAFGTNLATIPANVPYLRPAPQRVEHWRRKCGDEKRLRVGLVWAGDPRLVGDQMRSLHFNRLLPLLNVPGVAFYSMQVGGEAKAQLNGTPQVVDYTDDLFDFQETASLAENLDLTICVDTSSAHLVGAIGKPVWLLNRFNTCWRWMLDRSDSPWYPTMRIFRQPRLGDWDSVIAEVRIALEAEAAHKATQAAQAAQMA